MTEEFLQYVWQHKHFDSKKTYNSNNQEIEIISVGEKNTDAGPDFFNARIKIDNTIWAGNVEIHVNASDWNKHKHQQDKSYNNVILHVVFNNDKTIRNEKGNSIPTLEIEINKTVIKNYNQLRISEKGIKCKSHINLVNPLFINFWIEKLLYQRLEEKSLIVEQKLLQNKNNWEDTFYQMLAISFGSKTNALPFELLAKSIPLNVFAKHKNSLFQIEALLFGQAGFLDENITHEYRDRLSSEYLFLKNKFNLVPIEKHLWKFLRLRPNNFPTIRISQFAALIYKSTSLFSKVINTSNIKEINDMFDVAASEFWDTHYTFEKESIKRKKQTGKIFVNNILINTIATIIFAYGQHKKLDKKKELAIKILESLPAEKNHIINKWSKLNLEIKSAADTQSLIQLYNNYCKTNNCIKCEIGNKIITL